MLASEAMGEGNSDFDVDLDEIGWQPSSERNPYENLRNLYFAAEASDYDLTDAQIGNVAFKHIPGMGPSISSRAITKIREEANA